MRQVQLAIQKSGISRLQYQLCSIQELGINKGSFLDGKKLQGKLT